VAQIFVSHSRQDNLLRPWFDTIFAGEPNVGAVRFEFEEKTDYPILLIRFLIQNSDALFILLSREIASSGTQHTGNWMCAEVGMAGGLNKPVWLFEAMEEPIPFPIPFIDHYVRLPFADPAKGDRMFSGVRNIVKSYGNQEQANLKHQLWLDAGHISCSRSDCRARFQIYQSNQDFERCPVCCTSLLWPVATRVCMGCQGQGNLGLLDAPLDCKNCLGSGSFSVDMGSERCAKCDGQGVTPESTICSECRGNRFEQWELAPPGSW